MKKINVVYCYLLLLTLAQLVHNNQINKDFNYLYQKYQKKFSEENFIETNLHALFLAEVINRKDEEFADCILFGIDDSQSQKIKEKLFDFFEFLIETIKPQKSQCNINVNNLKSIKSEVKDFKQKISEYSTESREKCLNSIPKAVDHPNFVEIRGKFIKTLLNILALVCLAGTIILLSLEIKKEIRDDKIDTSYLYLHHLWLSDLKRKYSGDGKNESKNDYVQLFNNLETVAVNNNLLPDSDKLDKTKLKKMSAKDIDQLMQLEYNYPNMTELDLFNGYKKSKEEELNNNIKNKNLFIIGLFMTLALLILEKIDKIIELYENRKPIKKSKSVSSKDKSSLKKEDNKNNNLSDSQIILVKRKNSADNLRNSKFNLNRKFSYDKNEK